MPIYEYQCGRCGRFENIEKLGQEPLKECPHCASQGVVSPVEKLVSAAAFHLKGSGWYKTDYANSSCSSKGGCKPKDKESESSSKDNNAKPSDSEKSISNKADATTPTS